MGHIFNAPPAELSSKYYNIAVPLGRFDAGLPASAVVRQSRLPTLSKHRRSDNFSEESKGRSSVPATYSEPSIVKSVVTTSPRSSGWSTGATPFAARCPKSGSTTEYHEAERRIFLLMTPFLSLHRKKKKATDLVHSRSNGSRSI